MDALLIADDASSPYSPCPATYLVRGGDAPPLDLRTLGSLSEARECVDATAGGLSWGVALLLCHVQANWTGPALPPALSDVAPALHDEALAALGASGERAMRGLRAPLLLVMAQHALRDAPPRWRTRVAACLRHALGGATVAHVVAEERAAWAARDAEGSTEATAEADAVERAVWLCQTARYAEAWAQLAPLGDEAELTGRMGRRTKYQTFDVPQLVVDVHARTNSQPATASSSSAGADAAAALTALSIPLPDDNILIEGGPRVEAQPTAPAVPTALSPVTQLSLLVRASCMLHKGARDSHSVVLATPYVEALLRAPHTDYTVFTSGLWMRSTLEMETTRSRDRAVLQLDALVEQWGLACDERESWTRLRYAFHTLLPPHHALRRQAADGYVMLGALSTAAQIYTDLQLWAPLLRCLVGAGRNNEALVLCKDRLALEPQNWDLWCMLGDLTDDLEHYRKAWKQSGKHCGLAARCMARRVQDVPTQAKWWRRAVAVNVANADAQFSLGCCLLRLEEWPAAVGAFAAAVHLRPEDGQCWANLSAALHANGSLPQALVAAQQAVKHANRDARVWDNLARLALLLQRGPELARACDAALELNAPAPIEGLAALVVMPAGDEWRNRTETITALLDRALSAHPDEARLYALRSQWHQRHERWADALQDSERYTRVLRMQLDGTDAVWPQVGRALLLHGALVFAHGSADEQRVLIMSWRSLIKVQETKRPPSDEWLVKLHEFIASKA